MSATATHSTPASNSGIKGLVGRAIIFLSFLVAVMVGFYAYQEAQTKAEAKAATQAAYLAAHPKAQAPEYVTYLFGPDGCVEKYLGKARWSPIDRAIKVCDPADVCHIEVVGGTYPTSKFGPAVWKFCKADPKATGVVIWED